MTLVQPPLDAHTQTNPPHTHTHTHTAFSSLFTRCKRLTVLNTRCCTLIDDSAVFTLTQTNSFLVSLCLSGCHMITDQSLVSIAQKSKYLQVLDLTKTKVHVHLYSGIILTVYILPVHLNNGSSHSKCYM